MHKLRKQIRALEAAAAAKLAEITAETSVEDTQRIEREHEELLNKIAVIERAMKKAAKADDAEERDGKDDEPEDDDDYDGKKRSSKKKDEDGDADDDEDEDGEDGNRKGGKRNKDDVAKLIRSQVIELGLVFDQARALEVDIGLLSEAIANNEKPDDVRKRMFAALAKRSKQSGPRGSGTGFQLIRDEREGVVDAMEIALTRRILAGRGRSLEIEYKPDARVRRVDGQSEIDWFNQNKDQADQYRGWGLVEMAAQFAEWKGPRRSSSFLTQADAATIFERAFNTTSDFPSIFQNALNKALLARYQLHQPTYREVAAERTFVDFRPHPQVRAGDFPTLQPVLQSGELQYGSSTDNNEPISVSPYGVIFTISRTMLVNDDLGAIDQILGSAGDMVLVFENVTFYNMLNSNPVLNQDSTAVFHANHGNLDSVGAVPSVTSIGAGRQALRQMKTISGNLINVPPSIILTGPQQETAADQMVATITPTLTTSVNPFSGRLRSVSDANITDKSWYMLTDPARVPNFIYGFLAGSGGPRTRTFEPFGVQGIKISLEHDFGVGAIDYRGAYKSVGA